VNKTESLNQAITDLVRGLNPCIAILDEYFNCIEPVRNIDSYKFSDKNISIIPVCLCDVLNINYKEGDEMGFSLEGLFKQLEKVIDNNGIDEQDKLAELIEKIEWWKSYAIQCGNMKDI
jgi:hypothetical protein